MFEVVTLKSLGLEVTGIKKWPDIVEHVVPIVISYKNDQYHMREMFRQFNNFLMFEVVDLEKPWFGYHRYEEVTWYCWTCSPYSHIIKKWTVSMREMFRQFYNFLMFEVVTLKSLGLEVTSLKKWPEYCWTCTPYSHIIQKWAVSPREMFRQSTILLMFEVVTLKSLGLEVTGMRKWLDIVEHVVPIVISYKNNSIYERNVSKFYNFRMFEVVTLKSFDWRSPVWGSTISLCLR